MLLIFRRIHQTNGYPVDGFDPVSPPKMLRFDSSFNERAGGFQNDIKELIGKAFSGPAIRGGVKSRD